MGDKIILITGGSGSLGQAIARNALSRDDVRAVKIFSNDENQQVEMERAFPDAPRLRFLIGDVRDKERLRRAMHKVDFVIHAAALKHVSVCEFNPIEAVRTNVNGSVNVIDAAIDAGVGKVLAVSSDKAVHPINIYGATKLVMEKLFTQANVYGKGKFSCVRFGNFGGRGSVVPLIIKQSETGRVTITDRDMVRFWIDIKAAAQFTLDCMDYMNGGEIFIPKMSEEGMMDIVRRMAPEAEIEFIGRRKGEKLSEQLFNEDERPDDKGNYYIVRSGNDNR